MMRTVPVPTVPKPMMPTLMDFLDKDEFLSEKSIVRVDGRWSAVDSPKPALLPL
jgi:hypothetical protein